MSLPPYLTNALDLFESFSVPGFGSSKRNVEDGIHVTTKVTGEVLVNKSMLLESFMDQIKFEDLFSPMVKCSFGEKIMDHQATGEVVTYMPVTLILRSLSPAIEKQMVKATRLLKNTVDGEALVVDVEQRKTKMILLSGCRVKALSDAKCQVTFFVQRIYSQGRAGNEYVNLFEIALKAERWLETLKRECERRAIHGFIFSPLVDDGGQNVRYKMMLLEGKENKEKFFSHIFHEPFTDGDVQFREHETTNIFSACLSMKINSPHAKVFPLCKEYIFREFVANGVQHQIPEGNNNCFCLHVVGEKETLIEAYIDASEALLLYIHRPFPLYEMAGFTIENDDGDGSSYLTFAVIGSLPTDASAEAKELWMTNAGEEIQVVVANIIAAAVPNV